MITDIAVPSAASWWHFFGGSAYCGSIAAAMTLGWVFQLTTGLEQQVREPIFIHRTSPVPVESPPQFEIRPHDGVGPVRLGMTRVEVRDALAPYADNELDQSSSPTLDYAFGNSLQIEYGDDGRTQFIGVGFHEECGCDYFFHGRHVAEYSAHELFELLAAIDGGGTHAFNDTEYYFPQIMMTVWDADPQYDYLGGESRPVYGQVGIANRR